MVELKFNKSEEQLLNLNLKVNSKEQLESIIKNCKDNPTNTYNLILSLLTEQKK